MILEYCQLLSTAHRILDGDDLPDWMDKVLYKATHKNHPSSVWVRQNARNYQYVFDLLFSLHAEYRQRYGKDHASWQKLRFALCMYPMNISLDNIREPLSLTRHLNACPMSIKTSQLYKHVVTIIMEVKRTWQNGKIQ